MRSQAVHAEITRHIYEEFCQQKFVDSGLLRRTLSDIYSLPNRSSKKEAPLDCSFLIRSAENVTPETVNIRKRTIVQ